MGSKKPAETLAQILDREISIQEIKKSFDLTKIPSSSAIEKSYSLNDLQDLEILREAYEAITLCRTDLYKDLNWIKSLFAYFKYGSHVIPGYIKKAFRKHVEISFDDLDDLHIPVKNMALLTDLCAFDRNAFLKGNLPLERLKDRGIKDIVLMEDRAPLFFLNVDTYNDNTNVPLNRHGFIKESWKMKDLKRLICELQQLNIRVILGFWGSIRKPLGNNFIHRNWDALRPMIPISDDLNPLCMVLDEKNKEIPFADYVIQQYRKLNDYFGFDGLFLGDGLMGYRAFIAPHLKYNFSNTAHIWTDFYKRVYEGLKRVDTSDTLWAFDCLGKGSLNSFHHGLDLKEISKYIDNYIFQAYGNDAWGKYYLGQPGYSLKTDTQQISDLPEALKKKTRYSLSLSDSVEKWSNNKKNIAAKHAALYPHAQKGTLAVWANGIVRKIL